MEEAIVSLAVERISDLLIHEAVFLKDVKDQVESLRAELTRMQCFLKDADSKFEQDAHFQNRVWEIRDLAYDAEDAIDSFILKAAHQRGFHGIVKRFTSIFTKPYHLHKIGVQVKAIKTKLQNISENLPAFEIPDDGEGSSSIFKVQQQFRRTYSHVEEEDVVSLEVSTKDVMTMLMFEEDRPHAVVSIVGMGGLGKTTLARKVYNHVDVRHHFDFLAWFSISQQCKPREVWLSVLKKVLSPSNDEKVLSPSNDEREKIEKMDEIELRRTLFDALKEKRYLVVLDDIWRSEDWDILKPAFPRGRKGSKILFTTRIKNVASRADPWSTPVELSLLTDDESWNLLCRKAFPRSKMASQCCSEEFVKLGKGRFGGSIDVAAIVNFVDSGHDLIVAADVNASDLIREVGTECGVDFDEDPSAMVIDHIGYAVSGTEGDHTLIASDDFIKSDVILGGKRIEAPILFRGIGHSVSPANSLVLKVLSASPSAYSANPKSKLSTPPSLTGSAISLVSIVQARNNARLLITGSLSMFSNRFFRSGVQKAGSQTKHEKSGNEQFLTEISKWIFHERGHLKAVNVKHHRVGETDEPALYRINDELEYSVEIYEWSGTSWEPYVANDVQVQFYMMSPYVLKTLSSDKKGLYSASFKVPDVYGVFQFKVEHQKLGYTSLSLSKQIPVRPYRHNEYERFIPAAYPYYGAAFSMMAGFFIFSFVHLYSK